MKTNFLLAVYLTFCLLSLDAIAQEEHRHRPHPHRHKEYAYKKNPISMSEESISKGRKIYNKHCIDCHGDSGKGGLALNLTDDFWIHGESDGEIFYVIADGIKGTTMRGYKRILTEKDRWHLVNYIKSLKTK